MVVLAHFGKSTVDCHHAHALLGTSGGACQRFRDCLATHHTPNIMRAWLMSAWLPDIAALMRQQSTRTAIQIRTRVTTGRPSTQSVFGMSLAWLPTWIMRRFKSGTARAAAPSPLVPAPVWIVPWSLPPRDAAFGTVQEPLFPGFSPLHITLGRTWTAEQAAPTKAVVECVGANSVTIALPGLYRDL